MRQYLIGSWNNADGYDYSGEQLMGNRNGMSRRVHFNADGSAAVQSYGDDEPAKAKKPCLKDRIIPQFKRVQTLTDQLIELENAYRSGEYDIHEYTLMRGVVCKKRDRAVELYKKAIKVEEKASSTVGDDSTPTSSNHYQIPVQNTGNEMKLAGHSAKDITDDNKLFFGGILVCFVVWMAVKSFM